MVTPTQILEADRTASQILGVPITELTERERKLAQAIVRLRLSAMHALNSARAQEYRDPRHEMGQ